MTVAMKAVPTPVVEGFPDFDPGVEPRGPYVLIQEFTKPAKTKGGLMLLRDTKDFNQATVSVGKVIALGDGCYKSVDGVPWAEGPWCKPGDYVRVPRLSDEKWLVGDPEGVHAFFRMVAHDSIRGVFTDLSLIPEYNTVVA